ncbi:methyltransferase family protein [Kribbella sp. VKM Ac-2527]|uniref:Methyltransferase family protein n=2 Tax=Kribbella caucasensis TaxID=2512215 RepID=A0A4R6J3F4_9ACTN|nr:methyltransferase family protein [Kribbella sp. VKM Ac-2527]
MCPHSGGQTCQRCSWARPRDAVLLVVRGRTARKALPVAAVVGTVLSLVNQGSVIAGGATTSGTWVRVAVNYLVPFLVASIGYLSGRRVRAPAVDWPRYLAGYHRDRPGITERLLTGAMAGRGAAPYPWLVEPLRDEPGPILDLACGSAPTRLLLRRERWIGIDASASELAVAAAAGRRPLVRGDAGALPVADGVIGSVCAAMCLQVLTPMDVVLAEVRRVLRPGGMVVALVPSRVGPRSSGVLGWVRVMRALGIRSEPWPNPQARDGLARLLRAHGFVVDSDQRRMYHCEIADPSDAALLIDALYLPGVDTESLNRAKDVLASWATPGRGLPLPLRRVVAHLPLIEPGGELFQ